MEEQDENAGKGCALLASIFVVIIGLLLPAGIIWLLNKFGLTMQISVKNYIIVSIGIFALMVILFFIDVLILKFKSKDENSKKSN